MATNNTTPNPPAASAAPATPNPAPASGEVQPPPVAPEPPPSPVNQNSRAMQELLVQERKAREAQEAANASLPALRKQVEDALIAELKKDPLRVLQEKANIGYDQIAQRVLKGEESDPTLPLQQKIAQLEAAFEESQKRQVEALKKQELQGIQKNVHTYVSDNVDKYPLINTIGEQNAVYERMMQAQAQGQALSEEEATSEVEAHLETWIKQILSNDDLRKRFLPSQEPVPAPVKPRGLSYQDTAPVTATREQELPKDPQSRIQALVEWMKNAENTSQ